MNLSSFLTCRNRFPVYALTLLVSMISVYLTGCGNDPIPGASVAASAIVGNSLKDAADSIAWGADRAVANGDFALEKNMRSLQLISDSLLSRFEQETSKNREFVSVELQKASAKLSDLVKETRGGVLEVQDFAIMDIQNVLNQIPFKNDVYLIRRVEGYGIQYKESGSYELVFTGNAFQPGRRVQVSINDQVIDQNNIVSDRVANTLQVLMPVGLLNTAFLTDAIARARVELKCFNNASEKPFYRYNGKLLLLPKLPVQYTITEKVRTNCWTGNKDWQKLERQMGPTGKNGKWDYYTIQFEAPPGTRYTRKSKVSTNGDHSTCSNPEYTSDTKAKVNCANETHDSSRTATAELEYESSEPCYVDHSLTVSAPETMPNRLRYGTYTIDLSNQSVTYTAEFKLFNGRKVVLHPEKLFDYGIKVSLEAARDGIYKRLILEIGDPAYN